MHTHNLISSREKKTKKNRNLLFSLFNYGPAFRSCSIQYTYTYVYNMYRPVGSLYVAASLPVVNLSAWLHSNIHRTISSFFLYFLLFYNEKLQRITFQMVKGHYIMFFKRKKNGRFFLKFVLLFTIFKKGKKKGGSDAR